MSGIGANETTLWRRPDEQPSAQFVAASTVMAATMTCAAVGYCALFVVTGLRLRELKDRKKQGGARGKKKVEGAMSITRWVMLHAFLGGSGEVVNVITYFADLSSRDVLWRCRAGHKWGAFIYVGAMMCQMAILLERSKATLDRKQFWPNLIFKGTKLMTVMGMPAIMVIGVIVFEGSVFYGNAGGYCAQQLPLWLVWLFVVSSTGLNSCYLLLFLLPVYAHLKKSTLQSGDATSKEGQAATKAASKLRRTANKNLRLSTVQIVSTLVFQLLGLTFQTFFRDDGDHPEHAYLRQVQYTGYTIDIMINTTALLRMTNVWKPDFLTRRSAKVTTAEAAGESGASSSSVSTCETS